MKPNDTVDKSDFLFHKLRRKYCVDSDAARNLCLGAPYCTAFDGASFEVLQVVAKYKVTRATTWDLVISHRHVIGSPYLYWSRKPSHIHQF